MSMGSEVTERTAVLKGSGLYNHTVWNKKKTLFKNISLKHRTITSLLPSTLAISVLNAEGNLNNNQRVKDMEALQCNEAPRFQFKDLSFGFVELSCTSNLGPERQNT